MLKPSVRQTSEYHNILLDYFWEIFPNLYNRAYEMWHLSRGTAPSGEELIKSLARIYPDEWFRVTKMYKESCTESWRISDKPLW